MSVQKTSHATSSPRQALHARFAEHRSTWQSAIDSTAQLDALLSLATFAIQFPGDVCRPTFLPDSPEAPPRFHAASLGHPLGGAVGKSGQFVSNDVALGSDG